MPAAPPKLTPKERESLHASAQYFGMKLKANLGSLTKVKYITSTSSFLFKFKERGMVHYPQMILLDHAVRC